MAEALPARREPHSRAGFPRQAVAAALGTLYLQTLSVIVILFVYHVMWTPITIYEPVGAAAMFLLSWASGIGVGMETLSDKPLPLNAVSDRQLLSDGSNVIELKAYVQGEPDAIRDQTIGHGLFTVTSTFTLDYP